jgi:hypothetical protein
MLFVINAEAARYIAKRSGSIHIGRKLEAAMGG